MHRYYDYHNLGSAIPCASKVFQFLHMDSVIMSTPGKLKNMMTLCMCSIESFIHIRVDIITTVSMHLLLKFCMWPGITVVNASSPTLPVAITVCYRKHPVLLHNILSWVQKFNLALNIRHNINWVSIWFVEMMSSCSEFSSFTAKEGSAPTSIILLCSVSISTLMKGVG